MATTEEGSFRAGAARLGVTAAAVSKAVARLEEDLNTRLFDRTTRSIALTREGELYLEHCRRAYHEVITGRQRIEQAGAVVDGELVIALSPILAQLLLGFLPNFSSLYPSLRLRLVFSDRPTRLVQEQVDVALRIGPLKDSSNIALKLLDLCWVTRGFPQLS